MRRLLFLFIFVSGTLYCANANPFLRCGQHLSKITYQEILQELGDEGISKEERKFLSFYYFQLQKTLGKKIDIPADFKESLKKGIAAKIQEIGPGQTLSSLEPLLQGFLDKEGVVLTQDKFLDLFKSIQTAVLSASESHLSERQNNFVKKDGVKEGRVKKQQPPLSSPINSRVTIAGEKLWEVRPEFRKYNEEGEPTGRLRKDMKSGRWSVEDGWKKPPPEVKKHLENLIVQDENGLRIDLPDGHYDFVLSGDENFFINTGNPYFKHPSLIGGLTPRVKSAGELSIEGGKVVEVNNDSGHFSPSTESNEIAKAHLELAVRAFFNGKEHSDHVSFLHGRLKLIPITKEGSQHNVQN